LNSLIESFGKIGLETSEIYLSFSPIW